MNETVLALAIFSVCLFWTAWHEHREANRRDSVFMSALGMALASGSALAALATLAA